MRFDNIYHETGDFKIVVVPCPCINDVTGVPKHDCPYCDGDGRLQYSVFDLDFYDWEYIAENGEVRE